MLIDKKSFITKKIVFIRQRKALPATIYLSQNKVWHINTYHLPNIVFVNKKITINWQTQYLSAKEKWIIWQAKYLLSINKKKVDERCQNLCLPLSHQGMFFKRNKTSLTLSQGKNGPQIAPVFNSRQARAGGRSRDSSEGRKLEKTGRPTLRFPFLWYKTGEIIDDWYIQSCWVEIRIWILSIHFVLRTWRIFF